MPNETFSRQILKPAPPGLRRWRGWFIAVITATGLFAVAWAVAKIALTDKGNTLAGALEYGIMSMLGFLLLLTYYFIFKLTGQVALLQSDLEHLREQNMALEAEGNKDYEVAGEAAVHESWNDFDKDKLVRLDGLIMQRLSDPSLTVDDLAVELHVSRRQFFRDVKRLTGHTPNDYIRLTRLRAAKSGLESGRFRSISEAARVCGFAQTRYFSTLFKDEFDRSPADYIVN